MSKKNLHKMAAMKQSKRDKELMNLRIQALMRGMAENSPLPWSVQESTGDIVDKDGYFVARVGRGAAKEKRPVDIGNRDLIITAVQFYFEQKNIEKRNVELGESLKKIDEATVVDDAANPVEVVEAVEEVKR